MALIVAILVFLPMALSARGQGETGTTGGTASRPAMNLPAVAVNTKGQLSYSMLGNFSALPLSAEKATLSVSIRDPSRFAGHNRNDYWGMQEFERRTNVHIDWQNVVETPQYIEYMTARLASGRNLPDIIGTSGLDLLGIASAGLIIPLDDLIEAHAPNLMYLFRQRPDLQKLVTTPDGKMYSMKGFNPSIEQLVPIFRHDWLQKLGMQPPATLAEWEKYLRAVRDNDMNGNGNKNDEVPLDYYHAQVVIGYFGQAWGLWTNSGGGWSVDKNGQVQWDFMNPRWREVLAWFNKLYNENLIDRSLFSDPKSNTPSGHSNPDAILGATFGWNFAHAAGGPLVPELPDSWFEPGPPPKGPYGDQIYVARTQGGTGGWAVTKDSKNPALAVKWMDYLAFSKEGHLLQVWGIEGSTYKIVDGNARWMQPGKNWGTYTEVKTPQGKTIPVADMGMWGSDGELYCMTEDWYISGSFDGNPVRTKLLEEYKKYLVVPWPQVMLSKAENDAYNQYSGVQTYKDEMVIKFISGMEPLTNFDVYLQQLRKLGIEEQLKVRQAQYNRTVRN